MRREPGRRPRMGEKFTGGRKNMCKDPRSGNRHGEVAWGRGSWEKVGREGVGKSIQTLDGGAFVSHSQAVG